MNVIKMVLRFMIYVIYLCVLYSSTNASRKSGDASASTIRESSANSDDDEEEEEQNSDEASTDSEEDLDSPRTIYQTPPSSTTDTPTTSDTVATPEITTSPTATTTAENMEVDQGDSKCRPCIYYMITISNY